MEIREQTLDYFDALIYCESISEGTLDNWHLPDMLNLVLLHTRQREFNLLLAKRQGTLLYDEEYWCKDNSVIDLGIAFNMANSSLDICPKRKSGRFGPYWITKILKSSPAYSLKQYFSEC